MWLVYKFLAIFLKLLSYLPFRVLYILSDFLYVVIYYIVGYRKAVVLENLKNSFPEKSEKEIMKITRGFYMHFCDMVIEVIKTPSMSVKSLLKRAKVKNLEVIEKYKREGRNILLLVSHYGNWEWICTFPKSLKHPSIIIAYQEIENYFFNGFIKSIREMYGIQMELSSGVYKASLKYIQQGKPYMTCLVMDQTPGGSKGYWTTFLNQETAFFVGAEKMSKKLNEVVLFLSMDKLKRGFYEFEFKVLAENPRELPENEITKKYIKELEKILQKKPDYWLWSHRRWKYKRTKDN